MNRKILILVLINLTVFTACINTAKLNRPEKDNVIKSYNDIILMAGNDNTIFNYEIILTRASQFLYKVTRPSDTANKRLSYTGSFVFSTDTIFLHYSNNLQPPGLTKYLVREASGKYLIQCFTNGLKRVFLRIVDPQPAF